MYVKGSDQQELQTTTVIAGPHGYQVAKSHTSATCNVKKTGHQETATKIDNMGGVQWDKE
jgi:hypothetical protein